MAARLRILHLSDTHLCGDGRLHYGMVDTLAALDRVLAHASSLDAVDMVAASGDLSDDGSPASYRLLQERLEPWAAERGAVVAYAMGNHDLPDAFESVLGPRERALDANGFRILTVDTTVPCAGYGRVDTAQLDRLSEALAEPSEHGTAIVLHHPPAPPTTRLFDTLRLVDPEPLLEVCSAGDVRLILAGHYHHALVTAGGARHPDRRGAGRREHDGHPVAAARGAGGAEVRLRAGRPPRERTRRAHVVAVPAEGDGETVYALDAQAVAGIAAAAGWRGEG